MLKWALLVLITLLFVMFLSMNMGSEDPYLKAYMDGVVILDKVPDPEKYAVFFDIDATLLMPGTKLDSARYFYKGGDLLQPIPYMIKLIQRAKKMGYHVVILTARPENSVNRQWSVENLYAVGVTFDELHFSPYKPDFREYWIATKGMPILLTVGDQPGDVRGSRRGGYWGMLLPSEHGPYRLVEPEQTVSAAFV